MKRYVGIEIREKEIRVAVVQKENTFKVTHTLFLNEEHNKKKELRDFFAKHKLNPYQVTISISSFGTLIRKFNVPYTQRELIAEIIHYQFERFLFQDKIDDFVVDFHILETDVDKSKLLVAALRKKVITEVIDFVESCHIFPTSIDLDLMAIYHAASIEKELVESPGALILKVEEKVCNVLYLQQGKISDWRNIQLSFSSVSEALMVDMDETAEINLDALEEDQEYKKTLYPRLVKQLRKTFLTLLEIKNIYVCGDPEIIRELPGVLEEKFKIAAKLWSPGVAFNNVIEENQRACTVPVGLAAKMIDQMQQGYNFRKGEFAYDKSFDIVKKPLAIAASFVLFFLIIGAWQMQTKVKENRKQYETMLATVEKVQKEFKLPQTSGYWNQTGALKKALEGQIETYKQQKTIEIQDGLRRWETLFSKILTVRRRFYFTIENLSIDQSDIYLSGKVEQIVFFDLLKKEIEKITWVNKVELMHQAKTKNKKLRYSYKCWVQLKKDLQ